MHFNSLDYIILAILFISVVIGLIRGFVREIISLITWLVAFVAALKFSPWVATHWLHTAISHVMTRYIVSGLIIFLAILILGAIVNKLVHLFISATGFGFFDRLLGLVFGAARGTLCVTIMLLLIGTSDYRNTDWMKNSALAPHFQLIVKHFEPLLPKDLETLASLVKKLNANADVRFSVLTA